MQYNLLPSALCTIDDIEGNVSIDFNDMYLLNDYTDIVIKTINSGDKLVVDFDFGHRVHIDRLEYKFRVDNTPSSTIASGINFYYKNDSFDSYAQSPTINQGTSPYVYYTTLTSGIFAPRYMKVVHTFSGISPGILYGFKAFNNDSVVRFGESGNSQAEAIETAKGSDPKVKEIFIYNDGNTIADAYVNIEPTYSNMDNIISISDSINGPWISAIEPGNSIGEEYTFEHGSLSNLYVFNGDLCIKGMIDANNKYISRYSEGYYLSRIIRKDTTYCRFMLRNVGIGGHISTDINDAIETIEVRSHNNPPMTYAVIRELRNYTVSNINYVGYTDRWLKSLDVKENSPSYFISFNAYTSLRNYKIVFDQITERWVGYLSTSGSSSYSIATLDLFNNIGTTTKTFRLATHSTYAAPITFSWKEIKPDIDGGIWIYLYCTAYHSGDFIHSSGYFLAYFDSDLNNTFKWYTPTEEIGKMDIIYNNKCVWYTRPTTCAIYKVNTAGNVEINYSNEEVTYKLGGIATLPNGDLLFANDKSIHRLKYNGVYLSEYLIENVSEDVISYIALDGDGSEAIWTMEGMTVGRLFMYGERKGTYDFRITLDYPVRFIPVLDGIWVHCANLELDGGVSMKFISKENKRVDVSFHPTGDSSPGLIYQPYYHQNYVDKLPITPDTTWTNLEWEKTAVSDFLSSEDQFYQLRIVLRRQTPFERYPEFISSSSEDFIHDDNFTQASTKPKEILWGDWLSYPNTSRVYVSPSDSRLVLVPDNGGVNNSYINTKNRMIVGRDDNGNLDIRVKYTFGAGNGIASNKSEYLYIIAYNIEPGYYGRCIGAYIYINSSYSTSYAYAGYNSGTGMKWTSWPTGSVVGLYRYDGEIRLYWNGDDVRGEWRTSTTDFSGGRYGDVNSGLVGNYFYVEIIADRNSSQVKLRDFDIYNGNVYYYTESPQIESIYKQELLKISNIYPKNNKKLYVKTYIPNNMEVNHEYSVELRTRWGVPTY